MAVRQLSVSCGRAEVWCCHWHTHGLRQGVQRHLAASGPWLGAEDRQLTLRWRAAPRANSFRRIDLPALFSFMRSRPTEGRKGFQFARPWIPVWRQRPRSCAGGARYYELRDGDPPYAAKFYDCCGAKDPNAPGCTTDFHRSHDDAQD
uniref:Uncharacterized protein n=1 Tax=Setaria viridis TaxID=4556 RepID=A0A4U6TMY2_SETVI|nr:hypothetical protein SEVIR_8G000200v2 [Setaria viridis]